MGELKGGSNVLHILPGPIYDIESFLKTKFEYISKFSSGTVVSTSTDDKAFIFGNYKVVLVGVSGKSAISKNFKLLKTIVREAGNHRATPGLDLVVCYDPLKTGLIGLLVKRVKGCKLIVEVNGVYGSSALYTSGGAITKIKKYLYPKIQQFVIRRADGVKCLFNGQLKGFDVPNKVTLRCFFDFTDISPASYRACNNKTILSIGFPSYIKGFDLLVDAFNRSQRQSPDWKLVIIGCFNNQELNNFNAQIGVDSNIEIRKPVDFSEIPRVIDSCDIFVLASRTEAMGRVLLESMARGKARIGARVDGIPTVINHDEDGLLFEVNNVDDLTNKLDTLMASEAYRSRLAINGLERFNTEFSIQNYCENVENLYDSVLSQK